MRVLWQRVCGLTPDAHGALKSGIKIFIETIHSMISIPELERTKELRDEAKLDSPVMGGQKHGISSLKLKLYFQT